MQIDVTDLRDFYSRPLGAVTRRILGREIRARWRDTRGLTVMGLGFASPFLGSFRGEAVRLGALMPAAQGAIVWPASGPVHTVLVDEQVLPLPDRSVDRLLAIHWLEAAGPARPLFREIWRVLAPQGRLLLVVPNRRGYWARFDTTPFGHGQPYSRSQLERLLTASLLRPLAWSGALYLPPIDRRLLVRSAGAWESVGSRVWPLFSGVIMVEAGKEMEGTIPQPVRTRSLRDLVLAPHPAAGAATSRQHDERVRQAGARSEFPED